MKLPISLALLASTVLGASQFKGLNYNPKRQDGSCPNVYQVQEDLNVLRPYTNKLRIYSVHDCNQGEPVLRAMEGSDWKVQLGLWVNKDDAVFEADKAELLRLAGVFDFKKQVDAVIVGNEAIYRGEQTAEQVATKVRDVKSALKSAGLGDIPVSASETWPSYHQPLIDAVDFIEMHGFPFWEGVSIENAEAKMFEHINDLKAKANGKKLVVGETGWPSAGDNYGPAITSPENTLKYMQKFICRAEKEGIDYYWFNSFDQDWVTFNNASNVEGHWGIIKSDYKTPKFQEPLYTCDGSGSSGSGHDAGSSSDSNHDGNGNGNGNNSGNGNGNSSGNSSGSGSDNGSGNSDNAGNKDGGATTPGSPAPGSDNGSGSNSDNGHAAKPAPTDTPKCIPRH